MRIWIFLAVGLVVLLIVLLIVVLSSKITIKLDVVLRKDEYKALAELKMIFGLITRKYEVPFHLANGGIEYKKETVPGEQGIPLGSKKEKISSSRTIRYRDYVRVLLSTKGLKKWVKQTMAAVHLMDVRWSTRIALEHAADTAVATGMLHGVKHTLLGWMSHRLNMKDMPQIDVVPIFNGPPQISTELYCIAKISCGKAMYAGLVLIVRVLKVKGGVRSWQNTLFKA
ncbi:DUF2953 domain-containing protein [Paenibacillus glucanolyticus]|uniref:DUF2953 domain-containing protein n=1 Tax=Paenibacillus glucanolyticus TaxID=59843 RepID=UPI00096DFE76|nr:DUF2953 domain-containing protein [Paenibacillus glucanolyticus]OMF73071.1 hypothetical protein BK142_19585 [Paenibacillus glucanolyticus]